MNVSASKLAGVLALSILVVVAVLQSSFAGVRKAILFDLSGSVTGHPAVYQKAFEILQRETWFSYFIDGDIDGVRKAWVSGDIPHGGSVAIIGFASPDCIVPLAKQRFPEATGYNYRRVYIASRRLMQQFLKSLKGLKCNTNYTDIYNALAYVLAIYPELSEVVIISDMGQTVRRVWELRGEGKRLRIYLLNPIRISSIQEGYEEGEERREKVLRVFNKSSFESVDVELVNVIVRRKR